MWLHSDLLVRNYDGHVKPRPRRRMHLGAVAAAVVASLGAGDAATAATWSPATTVPGSEAGTDALVTRDGAGADTIGWLQGGAAGAPDRIVASRRALSAPFSTGILSSDAAAPVDPPAIAGDPAGPVALAWISQGPAAVGPSQIDYAVGSSGAVGARETLPSAMTGADPASVDVAVTAGGEAILTWTQTVAGVSRVRAVIRSADGGLSGVTTLSDAAGDASEPQVAATAAGAIVAWLQTTESTKTDGNRETTTTATRIQQAQRTPSGFTPGANASQATSTTVTTTTRADDEESVTTGQELDAPEAAADDRGGAAIAFLLASVNEHDPPGSGDTRTSAAQVATGSLDAGVSAPATISPPDQDADALSLSVAGDGAGVLAWTAGPTVHAARRAPGGPYGADELVAAAGSDPATAIRADGTPIVVYRSGGQIFAIAGTAGGAFESPVPLAPTDLQASAPAVSADVRGGAAAVWSLDPTPAEGDESVRVAELQPEPVAAPAPPPVAPPPGPAPPEQPPAPPAAPPAAPLEPSAPSPSSAPLILADLGTDPRCIRYGPPLVGDRKRLTFTFDLSEAASIQLTIQRRLNSNVMRRCPTRRVRGEAGRLGPALVVDGTSGAGAGSVSVGDEGEAFGRASAQPRSSRRSSRHMRSGHRRILVQAAASLAPGTYVARLTATSGDGRRSETLKTKFWILDR
jgi:hypothetical protein